MQIVLKMLWAFRAVTYSVIFKRFGLPSYIGKPVFLSGVRNITIGKYFRCFPGCRFESYNNGYLCISDDVAIAQNVHITCGLDIQILKGTCIAANSCITDTIHIYNNPNVNVLKAGNIYKKTIIGEDCFIGFGAVIDAGTILGKGCVVGANSYVNGVFPDHSVIVGNPAVVVKNYANE